jgi:hypothetical protein
MSAFAAGVGEGVAPGSWIDFGRGSGSLVTTAAQLRIIFADTGSEQQSVKSA